jgi:hypothetical protein
MPALATVLPSRRPEVVSWSLGKRGPYLVRNRQSGETFQVGEVEHFLLSGLDGCHTAEQLCAAFAERFGQPLSHDELEEFLTLAEERGFLHPEGAAWSSSGDRPGNGWQGPAGRTCHPPEQPDGFQIRPTEFQRIAARVLTAFARMLQWLTGLLGGAAQRMHWYRLTHLEYVPRRDDIFIVTYPRSGTTWMQMILYQLTSDGRMDIPHIAEYCPWFERSLRSGRGFQTRPSPRIFKSHLAYRQIPKGPCKYIYVARDGKDVAVSYYHLYRHYNGYQGTFAEFFELFLRGKVGYGSWFEHVRSWWAHRNDPNVLFLTYEELKGDLEGCLHRIIAFCGLDVPVERLPEILERCSFAFMKRHESRFDPALETLWEEGVKLNSFLRNGRVGEGAIQLSREQEARFAEVLGRHRDRTGFAWPLAAMPR